MKYLLVLALAGTAAFGSAGEVSLWEGNGNALDSIGPNNGTWVGTPGYMSGPFGESFSFSSGNYVSVANPVTGGLQSASGFTIAAWIDITTANPGGSLVNLRTSANDSGFTLEQEYGQTNTMAFDVNVAGLGWELVDCGGWTPGTWYMVAATFDAASGTMKIYQNGNLENTLTGLGSAGMTTNASSQFEIGQNIVDSEFPWMGGAEDVQFYNSALTDAQVRALDTPEPVTICFVVAGIAGIVRRARLRA